VGAGGEALLTTEASGAAGGEASLTTGAGGAGAGLEGAADGVFPECCFKIRPAPNANTANKSSAKTNFGLIISFQFAPA
jgi:hypothetical protein